MAPDLLDGSDRPRSELLICRAGVKRASQSSETESAKAVGYDVSARQPRAADTILLVEDEAFVRKVTAEVLESAGYRLMTASGAEQALEACRRNSEPIHLLLADVVMPGMNGRELAAEFEILNPQARVLLMTGYPEQLVSCERSGCDLTYMAKPFSVHVLLRRVREVLDTAPLDQRAQA
jgi:CheY-like chemotaxis protein